MVGRDEMKLELLDRLIHREGEWRQLNGVLDASTDVMISSVIHTAQHLVFAQAAHDNVNSFAVELATIASQMGRFSLATFAKAKSSTTVFISRST